MVCIVEHAAAQTLSRSSSFKGVRSPRNPLGPNPARFERAINPPQVISTHRQQSISPERRPAEPYEERIAEALKELYSCSPSSSSFDIYAPDVVFRDQSTASSIRGIGQVRAHFDALHKKYPLANVLRFDVSPAVSESSNSILIDVEVEYYRDMNAPVPSKTLKGVVVLELSDSQRHLVRHTERWEGSPVSSPVDDISLANQVPRRMSVTQRHAEESFYS